MYRSLLTRGVIIVVQQVYRHRQKGDKCKDHYPPKDTLGEQPVRAYSQSVFEVGLGW